MFGLGAVGEKVRSSKLLRRLEQKGVIEEPPESERPTLPSARKWGGKRGYCYVRKKLMLDAFDFEGTSYRFVEEEGKTYIYKIHAHHQIH
jgi:hypothetical protein